MQQTLRQILNNVELLSADHAQAYMEGDNAPIFDSFNVVLITTHIRDIIRGVTLDVAKILYSCKPLQGAIAKVLQLMVQPAWYIS